MERNLTMRAGLISALLAVPLAAHAAQLPQNFMQQCTWAALHNPHGVYLTQDFAKRACACTANKALDWAKDHPFDQIPNSIFVDAGRSCGRETHNGSET